jgi:hypothetical protein
MNKIQNSSKESSSSRSSALNTLNNRYLKDINDTTVINWDSGLDLQSGTLKILVGKNAAVGSSKLTNGNVLILNTRVGAESLIFLTIQQLGTRPPGTLYIGTKIPGVSFEVSSSLVDDDSYFAYMIVN